MQAKLLESAIYSMVDLFESDNSAAVLQINVTNAFNSLNRNVFLHNIKVICPEISNFVIVTRYYHGCSLEGKN